jgi:hypothetical protein
MLKNLRGKDDSTIVNAKIADGYLIAGLIAVAPFTPAIATFTDLDTNTSYRLELPIELANQPIHLSFANEYLPLIEVLPCQQLPLQPTSSDSSVTP